MTLVENAVRCARCGEAIENLATVWMEVLGWEHDRSQGGTNHVALRKRTGRLMHNACMKLEQDGIPSGQDSLL